MLMGIALHSTLSLLLQAKQHRVYFTTQARLRRYTLVPVMCEAFFEIDLQTPLE